MIFEFLEYSLYIVMNLMFDVFILQVQALYDFSGEPGTAELTIKAGDVLTVTRKDVGEGWWEGRIASGQTGLFPAAYVQVYFVYSLLCTACCCITERLPIALQEVSASQPPAMPPPPPPADVYSNDDWGETQPSSNYANTPQVVLILLSGLFHLFIKV